MQDLSRIKSRVFRILLEQGKSAGAEAFARHLAALLKLGEEDREACINLLPAIRVPQTSRQKRQRIEDLARAQGLEQHLVEQAVAVLDFLIDALLSEDIPVSDHVLWADDLRELAWIDAESLSTFCSLVKRLTSGEFLALLKRQDQELRAQGGVLPTFGALGITVELRPVRTDRYRWGTSVEEYTPTIVGTTMIASIHIGVDEGSQRDFYFQADDADLDKIMSSLRAAKKEMAAFRRFLRLDSSE